MLVGKGAWPSGRLFFTPLLSSVHRETSPSCVDYLQLFGVRNSCEMIFLSDNRKYELPPHGLVSDV